MYFLSYTFGIFFTFRQIKFLTNSAKINQNSFYCRSIFFLVSIFIRNRKDCPKFKKTKENYQCLGNSFTHVVIDRNKKVFFPRTVKSDKNRPNGRV